MWTTKSEDNYQANEFWWLRSMLRSDFRNKGNEINGKKKCSLSEIKVKTSAFNYHNKRNN